MSTQPGTDANLEQLLRSAAAAARDGKRGAANALFLALSREYADDARVWLGIAATTGDPATQRAALEHALALDPANERARHALERLGEPEPGVTAVLPETLTSAVAAAAAGTPVAPLTPPQPSPAPNLVPEAAQPLPGPAPVTIAADEAEPQRAPFPLLNLIAALVILLLLLAVGIVIGRTMLDTAQTAAVPTATLVLVGNPDAEAGATPTLGAILPTMPPVVATLAPTITAPATPGDSAPSATTPPDAQPTAPVTGTAALPPPDDAELPLGQIIDHDGWSATLLRPDYAMSLDGAIGDLQPTGRFVLAVVAISNNSPAPRVIPNDLFTLTDGTTQSYRPVPGASSAYLALYERGQRGDLALEDVLDPGSGMRSVPLIFDVPAAASGLRLTMNGAAGAGWPVGGPPPQPIGP